MKSFEHHNQKKINTTIRIIAYTADRLLITFNISKGLEKGEYALWVLLCLFVVCRFSLNNAY